MRADRPLAQTVVRWACLGGVVLLAAVPVYVFVEPPWRALVARLASAFVLAVALLELRRTLVERLDGVASALDEARGRPGPEPGIPYHFLDIMKNVRAGLRSRRHFEKVLWPRLTRLAQRPLARPPFRLARGPSPQGLRDVIAEIEKRP